MVADAKLALVVPGLLLAQQQAEPVLEQLDPPRRAAVIMALLGLVLVGLLLVTIILLGGNWARRLARHKPGTHRSASSTVEAARIRPPPPAPCPTPRAKSDETVQLDSTSKDTRMDE